MSQSAKFPLTVTDTINKREWHFSTRHQSGEICDPRNINYLSTTISVQSEGYLVEIAPLLICRTILALPAAGVNNECTSECLSKGAALERCAHYQCPMLIGVQLHNNKGTLCDKPALGVIARPLRLIQ
jgi:hypothetical protein